MEQAAVRAGIDAEEIRALRTALGLTADTIDERDLQALEAFKVMTALGFPGRRCSKEPGLVVREQQPDPVCGELVAAPPAARLSQDHEELWFCSQDCLRRFLLDEVG